MVHGKHSLVKSSGHTCSRWRHESIWASSCWQLHQFLSATSCACTHTLCKQGWNWKLWICGCSHSTLGTPRRDTLFPTWALLQRSSLHTTNTLTADPRLSSLCWKMHHLRWMPVQKGAWSIFFLFSTLTLTLASASFSLTTLSISSDIGTESRGFFIDTLHQMAAHRQRLGFFLFFF